VFAGSGAAVSIEWAPDGCRRPSRRCCCGSCGRICHPPPSECSKLLDAEMHQVIPAKGFVTHDAMKSLPPWRLVAAHRSTRPWSITRCGTIAWKVLPISLTRSGSASSSPAACRPRYSCAMGIPAGLWLRAVEGPKNAIYGSVAFDPVFLGVSMAPPVRSYRVTRGPDCRDCGSTRTSSRPTIARAGVCERRDTPPPAGVQRECPAGGSASGPSRPVGPCGFAPVDCRCSS